MDKTRYGYLIRVERKSTLNEKDYYPGLNYYQGGDPSLRTSYGDKADAVLFDSFEATANATREAWSLVNVTGVVVERVVEPFGYYPE